MLLRRENIGPANEVQFVSRMVLLDLVENFLQANHVIRLYEGNKKGTGIRGQTPNCMSFSDSVSVPEFRVPLFQLPGSLATTRKLFLFCVFLPSFEGFVKP